MNHFMDCDVKWKVRFIWQPATTSSVVGSSSSKSTSQSETRTEEKGHDHWWSAAYLIYYSFESWWNHYIWEVCSENRWDAPKTATPATGKKAQFSTKSDCSTSEALVLWRAIRAIKICLVCHICPTSRPLTTISSSILRTFCRENAFQEFVESQSTDFYATEITHFSMAKMCWL